MELLERSTHLDALAGYADEAANGNGRMVLIAGESGIGKTALIEAFQAQLLGARWLWGACDGLLTPRPLGPLFDIGAQAGGRLSELCREGATRDQLFDAFLAELDSPTALTVTVVEDVHWADESTIDLLRYVGRRLSRMKSLILVSYRDDEFDDDSQLMLLGDLATQRATRRIRLPPLSEAAVRALVGQHDVDAAELSRVTGGNPFLVCEAIEGGWPEIPPTVRDVVAARLARADTSTREIIQTAALIGTHMNADLLRSVLDEGPAVFDDCLKTGILLPDATSLRFRHELIRMAVAEAIPQHRKTGLHARLLAVLEEAGGADPSVLAHHAEGAGDAAAVRRYALAAARRSAELGAHREAAAQYERALRNVDAADLRTLAELHEGAAAEYELLDRLEESEAALRAALRYRRELRDDLRVGEDLSVLSDVLLYQCRGEEVVLAADQSFAVLRSRPAGPEMATALVQRGLILAAFGQHADGLDTIAQGLALAERLGRADIVSHALAMEGVVLIDSAQDGISCIEEALQRALEAGEDGPACHAYLFLQEACVSLQRLDDAERHFSAGIALGERRELRRLSRCLRSAHADTLLLLGNWDDAAEISAEVLAIPGVSGWNQFRPLRISGTIGGRRGEPGHMELLDKSEAYAAGIGPVPWVVQIRAARAELLWISGQPDLARREAREAFDQALGMTDLWRLGSLAIWLSRLGAEFDVPVALPEPYALEMAGDGRGAAAAWERLGRTYDAALTRIFSSDDETEFRVALAVLDGFGARAAAAAARRRLKDLGMTSIPRGPRAATRAAPSGLTAREQEVLALLAKGMADKEISQQLVISERTVHHHVSAILAKIGVPTRLAAAREAERMGVGG